MSKIVATGPTSSAAYVVAVSGGVDSAVLLHMLVTGQLPKYQNLAGKLVVAHVDHGIRPSSPADAQFVAKLARHYDLPYETTRLKLGASASEQTARTARYTFLETIRRQYKAQAIMTAHHQDDIIETMLINVLRGTGWRGLVSLQSSDQLQRPLLAYTKQQLLAYAQRHHLNWRHDETNNQPSYLRNYVRLKLLPNLEAACPTFRAQYVAIHEQLLDKQPQLKAELAQLTPPAPAYELARYQCIMWPSVVTRELLRQVLGVVAPRWHPSRQQIIRAEHFIKTGQPASVLPLNKHLQLRLTKRSVQFQKR